MCDKYIALILCFFLGAFGIHRFYEGKIITGVIYFCTLGLFGVGIIVDFVILLFKSEKYIV
jgi:TM2 domain-containing membrane protein YozV